MDRHSRPASAQGGHAPSREGERTTSPFSPYNPYFTGRPRTPTSGVKADAVDRREIIRKIKDKGIARQRSLEAQEVPQSGGPSDPTSQPGPSEPAPSLLPSPDLETSKARSGDEDAERVAEGLAISRPRSALHRGDFRGQAGAVGWHVPEESNKHVIRNRLPSADFIATSPPAPWHDTFSNPVAHRISRQAPITTPAPLQQAFAVRPRATSQASSLSRSFSYQPPSSPLVNQSNAEDLSDPDDLPLPRPDFMVDQFNRRRTYSPRALQGFADILNQGGGSQWSSSPPSMRRESTFPYKAHQPRRSVNSFGSLPQTPFPAGRRASVVGGSPLQHSMVGSFEESILRGRMSSTPSRPLDFTAHIGVLGTGDCKPSLKCPPHVAVPFPAVFYSYGHGSTHGDSQPSPYVGLVDLEGAAPAQSQSGTKRRRKNPRRSNSHSRAISPAGITAPTTDATETRRRKVKDGRRAHSPLDDPKGGYRIPPKGQLQIIIKNPNKTAVKLFLVPYDVSDIQPGQKTFIRQRSYSAGPIIDMPLDTRRNLGTDRPEASLSFSDDPKDRPVLRYLIHLHICCTGRGRIYLYKSVRVVFANRVPDGKEKLRNEIQLPEPRYSSYRPDRSATTSSPQPIANANAALSDWPASPGSMQMTYGLPQRPPSRSLPAASIYDLPLPHRRTTPSYQFPLLETVTSRPASRGWSEEHSAVQPAEPVMRVKSPISPLSPLSPRQRAISPFTDSSEGNASITFSRSSSSEKLPGVRAESLLSRRLRDFDASKGAMATNTK